MSEEEIWKPVPGYEGLYEVSSLGRVKALERVVRHVSRNKHEEGTVTRREHMLKGAIDDCGYLHVRLGARRRV